MHTQDTLCIYTYLQFSLGLFKAFSVTCINDEHDSIYCWEIVFPHSSCGLVPTKVKGCECYSSYRHLFFSYNYKLYKQCTCTCTCTCTNSSPIATINGHANSGNVYTVYAHVINTRAHVHVLCMRICWKLLSNRSVL